MSLTRLIARPMLASAYIANGVRKLTHTKEAAATVAPLLNVVEKKVDLPFDAATVARATGAAQVAAGSLLAIGKFPRVSSTVLVATYLVDVVGDLAAKKDPEEQKESLLMRTSLLGGALLASVDTAGKPGLAWRAQQAAGDFKKSVEKTSAKAAGALPFASA